MLTRELPIPSPVTRLFHLEQTLPSLDFSSILARRATSHYCET